jgi:sensor histidine kinase YesM
VNPEIPAVIRIHIEIQPQQLHLLVSNQKVANRMPDIYSGGLGIRNTRERLGIFYPSRHRLIIEDANAAFTVDLTLQLT